jgi:hypothetical protein
MKRLTFIALTAAAASGVLYRASAAAEPASGLYQIISGNYIECCGIGGDIDSTLPNESQGFVKLTIDSQSHLATMIFLGADSQTLFSVVPCPGGDPINFRLDYGFFHSDSLVFHVDPGPPPYGISWNYTVSNSTDRLRIDGVLGTALQNCVDVPTRFSHSNVVAVLVPTASIRVSEVEVCWNSVSNRNYQVQYRSALATNAWTNLGSPVTGNGSTTCITDKVALGQPQRFYRFLAIP